LRGKTARLGVVCCAAVCFIVVFASCATYSFDKLDRTVAAGHYETALQTIEKDKKKIYKNDAVRYYLDTGMIAHYASEYKTSSSFLENGDRAIEDAFTKSITESISSYIVNDTRKEYAGEDYENLYLNIFNALNYYHEDNFEAAMIEMRRLDQKLRNLSLRYNVIEAKLAKENKNAAKAAQVTVEFSNSALARYLGMLFYRMNNQYDNVRIDYNWLKRAFTEQKNIYSHPIPATIKDELEIPDGMARLNILAFSGLSPLKTEETSRIPLIPSGNWIKIALPQMIRRPSDVGAIELVVNDSDTIRLELLEDIQNVAIETFKKHKGIIEAKSILRATVKGSAAAGFSIAGETKNDALLSLIGIGLQIFAEASERADVRISRYFPARAFVAGVNLKPGSYNFSIKYYSTAGHIIASFPYRNFQLKSGALNLIETCFLH
jgi:hypothetical protein